MSDYAAAMPQGRFPLKRSDFDSHEEFYWTYQYKLAECYYIPLLSDFGFHLKANKVLDIGCGLGGFTAALADEGAAECVGIDVDGDLRRPGTKERSNLKYMVQDITAADAVDSVGTGYDLIVLHDVIEHVPLTEKAQFLDALKRFCKSNAWILITFPPYYSPFGLHQQSLLKSVLRYIPFLGWIPLVGLSPFLKILGEDATVSERLREIVDSRMTIRNFKRLFSSKGFRIEFEQYYLVRPTHEIRFGWRTRVSNITRIPILKEIVNSGALYLAKPV